MDWITGMQKAIDFIEDHITEDLDYEQIAAKAYVSSFHFQRVFSIMCGFTLGEYIRNRRLTLAGTELASRKLRVMDAALKYGYESPDSFAKAFTRFHGIPPSAARGPGASLKSFGRLSIKILWEGGSIMNYRIEEKPALSFIGYKTRFTGDASGRFEQERDFWVNTRHEQSILAPMRDTKENIWYDVNTNFDDEGYDHSIAVTSGQNPPEGFERIEIPAQIYVICETERAEFPTLLHGDLRKKIITEWLPSSDYVLAETPEIAVTHWFQRSDDEQRYIELWMPVERK